ncbi:MAG: enoyl-CoA hydratase/isomerase family protein [Chloroflexi bacterium]|nr:enoyl-CoA hydratase/isomerase family protein [Chloroflexota bacterium]
MAYEAVIYEKKGSIVYIILNRPHKLNALSMRMMQEMGQAWRQFNEDDAGVAIVTGAGQAMCAGADIKEIVEGRIPMARAARDQTVVRWGPRKYRVMKPVVAAIHGVCCGAGLDFATESDVVICSEDAQFFDSHVTVGLVSAHEMIQLSRRIPLGLALRMAVMGGTDRMDAQRAYQVGLVSEVVPRERLLERATEIARAILEQAPLAVRGTKQCILDTYHLPLEEALEVGEYIRRENVGTEDIVEGPRAFVEKRKPVWKGR